MPAPNSSSRIAAVAVIVFVANAGLLVLQLVAGRLLVPFIGSSLETWTAIIGVFLAGIAAGNAVGGPIADRRPTTGTLVAFLTLGALAAGWMMLVPRILSATGWHMALPLGIRVPILAAIECFPAGFVLSMLTPVAVKLGIPDVRGAGRAAGRVFAVGTLGCLAGNYVTGFYLVPAFTIDSIAAGTAGLLLATALLAFLTIRRGPNAKPNEATPEPSDTSIVPILTLRRACLIVFLCSFAGMALELTATRILAQVVGVSLYTWTGVIGVMLAGTAVGNWLGGVLADRAGRSLVPAAGPGVLAGSLTAAAVAAQLVLVGFFTLAAVEVFDPLPLVPRILAWTFALFFLPMVGLGTISPQVIRLTVGDLRSAGRVAGRVYAWSTTGAIVGTFATGYVLISVVGMYRTVLGVGVIAGVVALLVARVWERRAVLYALSLVAGLAAAGFVLLTPQATKITLETNYFSIRVVPDADRPGVLKLQQDMLVHSWVKPDDPMYLHYPHEQIQMEFLRAAPPNANVLVIGGGGYTYPRAAKTELPGTRMEVVEIDPGVTAVAYSHLGLDPALGIISYNLDGRQFVSERAKPAAYNLISLDAVNDLSVPAHLLTREFNEAIRRILAPNGVYLVTVIDTPEYGGLWKATLLTLRKTFEHVELLSPSSSWHPGEQGVFVIYAADHPLDLDAVRAAPRKPSGEAFAAAIGTTAWPTGWTHRPPAGEVERLLNHGEPLILTDQFAPVDNLMAEVFRRRKDKASKTAENAK